MKKTLSLFFLAFLTIMLFGCGFQTAKSAAQVFAGYGAGVRGLLLTVLDCVQESSLCKNVAAHSFWIDLYGGMQRAVGADVVLDEDRTICRTEGGAVSFLRIGEDAYIEEDLESIRAMKSAADSVGAQSFFLSVPRKTCSQTPFSARGLEDDASAQMEQDQKVFLSNGYSVLDLHAQIHAQGLDHAALYYRTDHHWNVYGAFWASREAAKAFGLDVSLLEREKYQTEKHPDFFLGSEGRHCGRLYCGLDDLDILIPDFPTDLTVKNEDDARQTKTGTFSETLLYREFLTKDYYNKDPYSVFLAGKQQITIRNNHCPDGKHIVMLKDSYMNSAAPYLAMVAGRLDLVDMRYFDGSVSAYLLEEKPDVFCVAASVYNDKRYAEIR